MPKLRIIVGGMLGQFPLGGLAWDYFHYVLGLHQLGHDVCYHEDTWVWPFDPSKGHPADGPDFSANFIRDFFDRHIPDLSRRWHYQFMHDQHLGMTRQQFDDFARSADLFLNISGACFLPDSLPATCVKAWMDTDPGYNHIRLAARPDWAEHIDRWIAQVNAHDRHLTYAENIHSPDCLLPRLNLRWIPTRPVVTLPQWRTVRYRPVPPDAPFTTVMTWDYFPGKLIHDGVEYHGKPPEYERFRSLPARSPVPLALAVGGGRAPRDQIRADGWTLLDALAVSRTPESYLDFIAASAGEWSIAKHVYVHMRTGWFSTRTACYLAGARPAVVQETGWSRYLPSGTGVHAFQTLEQAQAALAAIAADPARHRAAAYDIAREYLAPDRVLPPMLNACLR